MKDINLGEGFLTALFIVLVVFAALALVYILIKIVSAALRKNKNDNQVQHQTTGTIPHEIKQNEVQNIVPEDGAAFGGTLKLQNVDDQTAAMIMAIISDTSGIPLSELCFKSIRLITE